jgi:osmotically-inducible protein OsmY
MNEHVVAPRSSVPRAVSRLLLALAGAATLGASLSACAPLLVGGAVLGGTMVAMDRRTSGAQVDDQAIELKAPNKIFAAIGDRGHVNVTSYDRLVLLSGEVPGEADKIAVEKAMATLENVKSIVNELAVTPNSSITSRSNDSVLTTKVKATLLDAPDLVSNAYKVVTERGIVYLMGRVTEREGTRAANVTASIPGVQKVVRVFEVLSEQDVANLRTAAPVTNSVPASAVGQ